MTNWTWVNGKRWCSAEIHQTDSTCPDCEHNGDCADCGQLVAPGPNYRYCMETGEVIHPRCSPARAAANWGDQY